MLISLIKFWISGLEVSWSGDKQLIQALVPDGDGSTGTRQVQEKECKQACIAITFVYLSMNTINCNKRIKKGNNTDKDLEKAKDFAGQGGSAINSFSSAGLAITDEFWSILNCSTDLVSRLGLVQIQYHQTKFCSCRIQCRHLSIEC